jgi:hypothetical protein
VNGKKISSTFKHLINIFAPPLDAIQLNLKESLYPRTRRIKNILMATVIKQLDSYSACSRHSATHEKHSSSTAEIEDGFSIISELGCSNFCKN